MTQPHSATSQYSSSLLPQTHPGGPLRSRSSNDLPVASHQQQYPNGTDTYDTNSPATIAMTTGMGEFGQFQCPAITHVMSNNIGADETSSSLRSFHSTSPSNSSRGFKMPSWLTGGSGTTGHHNQPSPSTTSDSSPSGPSTSSRPTNRPVPLAASSHQSLLPSRPPYPLQVSTHSSPTIPYYPPPTQAQVQQHPSYSQYVTTTTTGPGIPVSSPTSPGMPETSAPNGGSGHHQQGRGSLDPGDPYLDLAIQRSKESATLDAAMRQSRVQSDESQQLERIMLESERAEIARRRQLEEEERERLQRDLVMALQNDERERMERERAEMEARDREDMELAMAISMSLKADARRRDYGDSYDQISNFAAGAGSSSRPYFPPVTFSELSNPPPPPTATATATANVATAAAAAASRTPKSPPPKPPKPAHLRTNSLPSEPGGSGSGNSNYGPNSPPFAARRRPKTATHVPNRDVFPELADDDGDGDGDNEDRPPSYVFESTQSNSNPIPHLQTNPTISRNPSTGSGPPNSPRRSQTSPVNPVSISSSFDERPHLPLPPPLPHHPISLPFVRKPDPGSTPEGNFYLPSTASHTQTQGVHQTPGGTTFQPGGGGGIPYVPVRNRPLPQPPSSTAVASQPLPTHSPIQLPHLPTEHLQAHHHQHDHLSLSPSPSLLHLDEDPFADPVPIPAEKVSVSGSDSPSTFSEGGGDTSREPSPFPTIEGGAININGNGSREPSPMPMPMPLPIESEAYADEGRGSWREGTTIAGSPDEHDSADANANYWKEEEDIGASQTHQHEHSDPVNQSGLGSGVSPSPSASFGSESIDRPSDAVHFQVHTQPSPSATSASVDSSSTDAASSSTDPDPDPDPDPDFMEEPMSLTASAAVDEATLQGITFGYCPPSATLLNTGAPSLDHQGVFPDTVRLSRFTYPSSQTEGETGSFKVFSIEAPSWTPLLHYLMWHGNSRIEAAPKDLQYEKAIRGMTVSMTLEFARFPSGDPRVRLRLEAILPEHDIPTFVPNPPSTFSNYLRRPSDGTGGRSTRPPLGATLPIPLAASPTLPFTLADLATTLHTTLSVARKSCAGRNPAPNAPMLRELVASITIVNREWKEKVAALREEQRRQRGNSFGEGAMAEDDVGDGDEDVVDEEKEYNLMTRMRERLRRIKGKPPKKTFNASSWKVPEEANFITPFTG